MATPSSQSFHLESQYGKLHQDAIGFEFNGTDDFIALPSHWGGNGWHVVTLEAWIKVSEDTGDFQAILSPGDTTFVHFQTHREGVGNISIYTDQGAILLPTIPTAPLNQWRHVAVIAESGASRLMIDGHQVGDINTKTFNYVTATDELFVGKGHANGRFFKGQIAGLKIWHDAKDHANMVEELYRHLDVKPEIGIVSVTPTPHSEPEGEKENAVFGYKSAHGKYMSAQPDGRMECNRDHLHGWEKFTVEKTDGGKIGLKSIHGKYLSAQPDGRLEVNRDHLLGWEKFTVEENNGRVGFKSAHGKYISAQPDGSIVCNRDRLASWEMFVKESVKELA